MYGCVCVFWVVSAVAVAWFLICVCMDVCVCEYMQVCMCMCKDMCQKGGWKRIMEPWDRDAVVGVAVRINITLDLNSLCENVAGDQALYE